MTNVFTTALTGFFVFGGVGGMTTGSLMKTESLQAPTYQTYTVAMSGYNAVPEQTDSDPSTTASGAFSDPDLIVARSADLKEELPFGTVIAITNATSSPNCGVGLVEDLIGLRVVGDSMHPRKRNQIDILFDKTDTVRARGKQMNPALVLGMCKDIEISVVGHVDIAHMPKNQAELKMMVGKSGLAVSK